MVSVASRAVDGSGKRLAVSRQAVAQAVAALERHDYVSRVPDPVDARARVIELTPRGRQALRVMRSNAIDVEERWTQILGQRRLADLRKSLQLLLAASDAEATDAASP
ncbi:MarR family transcriptional regulator [Mycobacterium gastri 'Wayne']|nr:MarR family transcriptional regulator [Mycobacterium gastri 'Wayne']